MTNKKNDQPLLIIFYRNPEIGKVKTRLAATIGDSKAMSLYLMLCQHTITITENLSVAKALYYSDYIDFQDNWPNEKYHKFVQSGPTLGERMENAFQKGFNAGYKSICIIGTDCLELTSSLITESFRRLRTHDLVIGPANDGGYYLLGMHHFFPYLFKDKNWSTNTVLSETLHDAKLNGLNFFQMESLNDIDEEKDLPIHFRD